MNLFTTMEQQQNNKTTRQQLNYKNGKIYKIKSPKGDLVYIGSTTQQYLSQRYAQHISCYTSYKLYGVNKGTTSAMVFDAYGIENCSIELIENYPCESRQALDKREFYFINSIPCVNYRKQQKTIKQQETTKQVQTSQQDSPSITCPFCPKFLCKLKSDYTRHIATSLHLDNEKVHLEHEKKICNITLHHRRFGKVLNEFINKKNKQKENKDRLIERKLCLNQEFIYRAFLPVHKYNTRELFVDINDLFSPSYDRAISYLNCDYFHTSKY